MFWYKGILILTLMNRLYLFIKRLGDIILSLCGLIFLSPFLLVLIILIKADSPGSVLFCQKRVGEKKVLFNIYKFRTMRTDTPKDIPTHLLENPDQYITKTGRIMRRFSLDEIPQLLNILRSDMSIIGPRPALWNQNDLISERDKYGANDVRPGLTGLAQISGRDELPIPIKAKYDGEYVKKMNLLYDCKIFFMTIYITITGKGLL